MEIIKKVIFKKFTENSFLSIGLIYFFVSIAISILFIGYENLIFTNTEWLFSGNDMSAHQSGWYFFKNDIWRFPIGSNPNYGINIGNSVVYSDSIPLLAFFFKLLDFLLPNEFQYFGLWFLLCFFLQGFLSYLLVFKFTKNVNFSFLCSIFFIFFPIFIYRLGWHPSLFGQWTLFITIYLMLGDDKKLERKWVYLIIFTSLIHFYFTFINLLIYNFYKIYSLINKNLNLKNYFIDCSRTAALLIIAMYCIGYFEVRISDTLALGFGVYKLNLLSLIDAVNSVNLFSWSLFLPDIKLSEGEELEGFNFIGFGGIILLTFLIYLITFKKKIREETLKLFLNKKILIILIFITFLSLSNNISIGSFNLIQIELNKFLYGFFSIIRSSGRLFWLVNYFFMFLAMILIYSNFKKKTSIFILLSILIIQIIDISNGLQNYIGLNKIINQKLILKDNFWNEISTEKKILLTTNAKNYNKHFDDLAYFIQDNEISKTNLIKTARIDRKKISESRYNLYKKFVNYNLDSNTIYIIDNYGHLLTLKELYKNKDVGFFYKDKIWIMLLNKKKLMNKNDDKKFYSIKIPELEFNQKYDLTTNNIRNILGFGWSHNYGGEGVWSDGPVSNFLFQVKNEGNDIIIELSCNPFINTKIKATSFDVLVNGQFNNKIIFDNKSLYDANYKVKIKINNNNVKNNKINLQLLNNKPVSPSDLLLSPDSRKIGLNVKSIKLYN